MKSCLLLLDFAFAAAEIPVVANQRLGYNGLTFPAAIMSELDKSVVYEFGPFRVDPLRRQLSRDDTPLPITSKAFETLIFLVHRNGMTVTKRDLIDAIWAETAVEEIANRVAEERLAITRKAEQLDAVPGSGQSLGQLLGLSSLAGAVNAFDHDQRSHGVLSVHDAN